MKKKFPGRLRFREFLWIGYHEVSREESELEFEIRESGLQIYSLNHDLYNPFQISERIRCLSLGSGDSFKLNWMW